MGYQRHFIGETAHSDALDAMTEWCTPKQLMALRQCMAGNMPPRYFIRMCWFAGIQGYPIRAFMREYHGRYVRRFGPKSLQLLGAVADAYPNEEFK